MRCPLGVAPGLRAYIERFGMEYRDFGGVFYQAACPEPSSGE